MKFNNQQLKIIKQHLAQCLNNGCPMCDHPHFAIHNEPSRLPRLHPLPPEPPRVTVLVVVECKACHHLLFYPSSAVGITVEIKAEKDILVEQAENVH